MLGHDPATDAAEPLGPDELPRSRAPSFHRLQSRIRRSLSKAQSDRSYTVTTAQVATDVKGPLGLNLLHEPLEPQIDFVFIHGLGGGSTKTWSYAPESDMFWPQEWLPSQAGFENVRLHSYGYNSDWTSKKDSHLTVHDFGQALLADLQNSPSLRKHDQTPIVFVAHSMGGLVAKKACLLASRDPACHSTAQRIQALYFLGTPHRGADSATLAKYLRRTAGYGTKAFVNDLLPGSGTLDQINDEFRHVCGDMQIWSFLEAQPTSFGLTSSMVVDKQSAVLGLPNERIQYLEADHRQICKFSSRNDANYLILQRAFLTTIDHLRASASSRLQDDYRAQMKKIASFLRASNLRPGATLLAINEKQHAGSCQWLTGHTTFMKWRDATFDQASAVSPSEKPTPTTSRILWLHGRPGTGKSVAASHVIRHLQSRNLNCSFYFFRHDDTAASNVASLLRSLASQMAEASVDVRRTIVSMIDDCVGMDIDDHYAIWTSLFIDRIFKAIHAGPQYWVIDAVDECEKKAIPTLISMLSNLDMKVPIRIFITSRPGGEVGKYISAAQQNTPFLEVAAGESGTMKDIELFLHTWSERSENTSAYQELVSDVLAKSNGIFLWASLTVFKLEDAYSIEDRHDVLQKIPSEMDDFYSRIVAAVVTSPSAVLAKCVLNWVLCSPRQLYLAELTEAVKMDIGRTLTASARQLETMTGHLIFVDNQSRVYVAHETTTRFLTQAQEHGFWVDRDSAHTNIAEVCLKVLCSADFSPPTIRRGRPAVTRPTTTPSDLADYATFNFSHHIAHGFVEYDSILLLLSKFLKSNVLTWIERIASTGSLWCLKQTSQRLKSYLSRGRYSQAPTGIESQTVAAWASDIHHIVSAFHTSLLASPSSIHTLIPYLCPRKSMIRELFAPPSKRLSITGMLEDTWDDRLASCVFPEGAMCVACSGRLLGVGLFNGEIKLYNFGSAGTFDLVGTAEHGRTVGHLALGRTSTLLASASPRKLVLWDIGASGVPGLQRLWSKDLDFTPFSLEFSPSDSSVILTNPAYSAVVVLSIIDGQEEETKLLHSVSDKISAAPGPCDQSTSDWTPAQRMRLSPDNTLAAIGHRNAVVTIWNLVTMECVGDFEREGRENTYSSPPSIGIIFNPVSELDLLAITYEDGDIAICNPWTLETEKIVDAGLLLAPLAATSDGRVLAGAAEDNSIHLFRFETLQPIYRITGSQLRVRGLAFSADNLRFFDVRSQCCNVWEPDVLATSDCVEEVSLEKHSVTSIPETFTSRAHVFQWGEGITAIETAANGGMLFAGRQDGSVDIYDLVTGADAQKLRLRHSFEIKKLEWHESESRLFSLDISGNYRVTALPSFDKERAKSEVITLLDGRHRSEIISQLLVGPGASSVLVCTISKAKLVRLDGAVTAEVTSLIRGARWMHHPLDATRLVAIQNGTLHLFDWGSLTRLTPSGGVRLQPSPPEPMRNSTGNGMNPWVYDSRSALVAAQGLLLRPQPNSNNLVVFDMTALDGTTKEISFQVLREDVDQLNIERLIGCQGSSIFFLDTGGWVCSINGNKLYDATHYTRHFFIPPTWRTGSDIVTKIVSATAIAFGLGEQLIVFHGFLEFEEKVPL